MTDFVTRSMPFTLERSEDDGDGLTLCGYAAVFNSPTRIRGEFPAEFDEVLTRGAFAKTIRERKPVLMFEHGKHPLVGSMPIGQITTIREDARGLYVEARLHDNWLTQPVRDAIASGSVDGMSFRFSVVKGKEVWDRSGQVPLRTIAEVNCPELGPVVFPAYADTEVSVRSMIAALDDSSAAAVVQAFRDATGDADAVEVSNIVDQVEKLIAELIVMEAGELAAGQPQARRALSALLSVLAELNWFEMIDTEMAEYCSATDLGTSRRAALRTLFAKPPSNEPASRHSMGPAERTRVLRELTLEGLLT